MILNSIAARVRGISAVEILVVLAVLTVIGAMALPSQQKDTAKADMQAAVEDLQQAIYLARSSAISKQADVIMHLVPASPKEPGKVTFSFATSGTDLDSSALDHVYVFPAEIRLETAVNEVLFNSLGKVESPARIRLISSRDAGFDQRLLIE